MHHTPVHHASHIACHISKTSCIIHHTPYIIHLISHTSSVHSVTIPWYHHSIASLCHSLYHYYRFTLLGTWNSQIFHDDACLAETCVSMENLRILGARESQRRILYEIFMITEIFKFSCFWVCLVNNFHVFWWFELFRCFRISLLMKFESFLNFYYNEEKF